MGLPLETSLFRYIWQKSRSEQIVVLLIILVSIPFQWASFDVPKRIVNDAIQGGAFKDGKTQATVFEMGVSLPGWLGGASFKLFDGLQVGQLGLLLSLSCYFLLLVLINGLFKYVVNVRKGVLGERMLRRMRYDLFGQFMRFRPEDMRSAKPAEVASMIKDEVEPIGSFVGDAFIQPAFLLSQALTALFFIMAQSVWLGSIALAIVVAQAVIIPILRREQLRLGRERQIASRHLAGRIGEIVDAGPAIQGHGATAYVQADIAGRLGQLFDIRYALYKRKFAVKFLNNLLAQITPFFFYAIGGYFALQGRLDIGQLVAVIAAYRDLPPPIKELIDWDQQRNDVTIKYDQVITQFSPAESLELEEAEPVVHLPETGEIVLSKVEMFDNRGQPLLAPLSLTFPRPGCVALIGSPGGARDTVARIIGRQIMSYGGGVTIDGEPLRAMSVERASHLIGYAGADTEIINGTLRDNVLLPLRRHRPDGLLREAMSPERHRAFMEAVRSGNTPLPFEADWTDYEAVGLEGDAQLNTLVLEVFEVLGCAEDVYELGLDAQVSSDLPKPVLARIIEAREVVAAELAQTRLGGLIEVFDPARYNANATIAENLLFGALRTPRFASADLLWEPYARSILQAEALVEPLADVGSRIVATLVEIFEGLPQGHVLFERYNLSAAFDLDRLRALSAIIDKQDMQAPFDPETQRDLVALALGYVEPKHRLGLLDDALRRRILRARASFKTYLPADAAPDIDFYDPKRVIDGASLRDNLLFGRIGYGIADAKRKVGAIMRGALNRGGLDGDLFRLGLNTDSGLRGRHLPVRLKAALPLAQALVKRPDIVVLDPGALLGNCPDPAGLLAGLRRYCAKTTLVLLLTDPGLAADIRCRVVFDGATGLIEEPGHESGAGAPGPRAADVAKPVEAET